MNSSSLPSEITDPAKSAVIVVDVQNDFIHEDGRSGLSGDRNAAAKEMAENRLAPFVAEARAAGALIVWIQMGNAPETTPPANARMKRKMYGQGEDFDIWQRAMCVKGSWGAEFYLKPEPDDEIVAKTRYSSFIRTRLDELLKSKGIETAVVTGVVTNQCVESTARDAYQYDYDVVVVSDCVSDTNEQARAATFASVERSFGWVRTAAELLDAWKLSVRA